MAFKMKNTAYYKKKFTESEMASPHLKGDYDVGKVKKKKKKGPQQPDGTYLEYDKDGNLILK